MCFRCLRSLSFRNLRFGRRRLGWLLFGGLWLLLLLLFLRWLLNLFHFIFVSHGKYSSSQKNGVHNIIQAWLTVCSPFDSAINFFLERTLNGTVVQLGSPTQRLLTSSRNGPARKRPLGHRLPYRASLMHIMRSARSAT